MGDGSPGPIVNGLVLSINHASGPVWNNSGAMWVKVNDLTGTHTDGTKHTITTNMILTSHSDGGKEFEVGNLGLEPLVIRKIIPPTGNATKFKLMLSGYTKFLTNDSQTATTLGISQHDIFTNVPTEGQELFFKQPVIKTEIDEGKDE